MDLTAIERLHFNWVVEDFLAGCSRPGDSGASLQEDLGLLRGAGAATIVSLIEEPLDEEAVRAAGFEYLHVFCADGQPPANTQMHELSRFIESQRRRGRRVVLHCLAGMQRTMTGMAAYLIAQRGFAPGDALTVVYTNRLGPGRPSPVAITPVQHQALRDFADWLRGRGSPAAVL